MIIEWIGNSLFNLGFKIYLKEMGELCLTHLERLELEFDFHLLRHYLLFNYNSSSFDQRLIKVNLSCRGLIIWSSLAIRWWRYLIFILHIHLFAVWLFLFTHMNLIAYLSLDLGLRGTVVNLNLCSNCFLWQTLSHITSFMVQNLLTIDT